MESSVEKGYANWAMNNLRFSVALDGLWAGVRKLVFISTAKATYVLDRESE